MAATLVSLGRTLVVVAGTPVAVQVPSTVNPPTCHAFVVEALSGNTGKVYIGLVGLNKSTLVGCLVVLPVPTANLIPTFSVSVTAASNAVALDQLYIDADNSGEGVLISAVVC